MIVGRLHVLTDYHFQQRFSHAELAAMALEGGASTIQFRDKGSDIRHLLRQALATAVVCRERSAPLIVNDRVDLALAVEADGVHLGQTDMPVRIARRILGDSHIIGATATTEHQAIQAEAEGADYVGFGPVYPTSSKANPASVKGLEGLRRVCASIQIPVMAIAGITEDRVAAVLDAGAYGIAVMTAVSRSQDPAEATRRLRRCIDTHVASREDGTAVGSVA